MNAFLPKLHCEFVAILAWKTNVRPFDAILHNTQFSWAYGHPVALSSFKLPSNDPRNLRLKLESYNTIFYSPTFGDDFVFDKFQVCVLSEFFAICSSLFYNLFVHKSLDLSKFV